MNQDPVRSAQKRINAYWYEDGIPEMAGGAIILVIGLTLLASDLLPEALRGWLTGLGLPAISLAMAFGLRRVMQVMKERITYPRTGYIAYRKSSPRRLIIVASMAVVISVLNIVLINKLDESLAIKLPSLLLSLAAAVFSLYRGLQAHLARFYVLAALSFVLAPIVLTLAQPPYDMGIFLSVFGMAWLVSGALTFRGYLRKYGSTPGDEEAY
jgi:uncharacterized membrane protein